MKTAVNANPENEDDGLTETDLDELIKELENDIIEGGETEDTGISVSGGSYYEPVEKPKQSFWQNLKRSWKRKKGSASLACRFQRLAGITPRTRAVLTLPDSRRIEFTELPSWFDVVRFKLCGFKYESYE